VKEVRKVNECPISGEKITDEFVEQKCKKCQYCLRVFLLDGELLYCNYNFRK